MSHNVMQTCSQCGTQSKLMYVGPNNELLCQVCAGMVTRPPRKLVRWTQEQRQSHQDDIDDAFGSLELD